MCSIILKYNFVIVWILYLCDISSINNFKCTSKNYTLSPFYSWKFVTLRAKYLETIWLIFNFFNLLPSCSNDRLMIIEDIPVENLESKPSPRQKRTVPFASDDAEYIPNDAFPLTPTTRRTRILCGDWSDKVKLLRHVSSTNEVVLEFQSDLAHDHFGFKLKAVVTEGKIVLQKLLHYY